MTMIIRRATTPEAKGLRQFDEFIGERRIDNWRGELFVCVLDEEIVGFICFNANSFFNRPFIHTLQVREDARRKGVATALVRRVVSLYDGIDLWTSTEDWNTAALTLFEREGFVQQGGIQGLNADGVAEIMLKRAWLS